MGREEQVEEREVLDSIFPDEITDISETQYKVTIKLDDLAPLSQTDEEEAPEVPTLTLHVSYPETYPDAPPDLSITLPPSAPTDPFTPTLHPDDIPTLLTSLTTPISENLGMAMIYTLILSLQDTATSLLQARLNAIEDVANAERAAREAEENRKFEGEKVTRESFLKWRDGFVDEMEREREEELRRREEGEKVRVRKEEKKLTGRELWERGMVGKVDEDEEGEDAVEVVKGVGGLSVAG
ncbi:MAG: hypothetical protein M1817_001666 [Caeruleum heppii]|nr:MAG: hypothetical protein M1817_001666 [Caeruleum heppii]